MRSDVYTYAYEMCLRDTIPHKDSKHRPAAKRRVVLEIKSQHQIMEGESHRNYFAWLQTRHEVVIHIFVVQDTHNLNHKIIND